MLTRQARRLSRLPWTLRMILGIVLLALGLAVVAKPFDSLTLLIWLIAMSLLIDGAERLLTAEGQVVQIAAGSVLVLVAVIVVAWPAISVAALAVVVGIGLMTNAAHDLTAAWSERNGRVSHLLSGAAWLIFGVLALVWPDVAILVIAIAFGVRMILFGIGVIAHAVRGRNGARPAPHPRARSGPARALGFAGRGFMLALALALLTAGVYLHDEPTQPGAFYTAPRDVPTEPGQLIRSKPYSHGVPDGVRGWLILYTTTGLNDEPRTGSAFVMAPERQSTSPREAILWTHGTEGADATCAPTLLPEPSPLVGPVAAMKDELANGRVIIGPDYPGTGTGGRQGYLIGEDEGRSALDAVRAARQLDGLRLADKTVVWGHSQGGQAALWTGILAPTYAPDVTLLGVAAASPASDLPKIVTEMDDTIVGQVMGAYVMRAYSETYPDVRVDDYVDPRVRTVYRAMSRRCLPAKSSLISVLSAATMRGPMFNHDPGAGPLGKRLAENVPTGHVEAPTFIAQGSADGLVLPTMQDAYVARRCADGQRLLYRTYAGKDHLTVLDDDSPYIPDLVAWTQDRFTGQPQEDTCG